MQHDLPGNRPYSARLKDGLCSTLDAAKQKELSNGYD